MSPEDILLTAKQVLAPVRLSRTICIAEIRRLQESNDDDTRVLQSFLEAVARQPETYCELSGILLAKGVSSGPQDAKGTMGFSSAPQDVTGHKASPAGRMSSPPGRMAHISPKRNENTGFWSIIQKLFRN